MADLLPCILSMHVQILSVHRERSQACAGKITAPLSKTQHPDYTLMSWHPSMPTFVQILFDEHGDPARV